MDTERIIMTIEEFIKRSDEVEAKTDFIVSWFAKKYNKTIFRVGNLNKKGCRTWKQNGSEYMCFWDTVLERYTTCIDPVITYRKKVN